VRQGTDRAAPRRHGAALAAPETEMEPQRPPAHRITEQADASRPQHAALIVPGAPSLWLLMAALWIDGRPADPPPPRAMAMTGRDTP